MSKTIDTKVVEMRFDNANFEKNVKQSMTTIEKLKASLNLDGATKGLEQVEKTANNVNFNKLYEAVDEMSNRFSMFGIAAMTVIQDVTRMIEHKLVSAVKSLSTDNIIAGWQKLQLTASSMSTLISQGFKLDDVEKQVDKLNWFTDETSYNLTDMIENISKFTGAGKNLEDSVTAMQGIALWAAKSGQNAQKATSAMYAMSQAIGSGQVTGYHWRMIETAQMATKEFKELALETAVEKGTLKKTKNGKYKAKKGKAFDIGGFKDSLAKSDWFTSDVMMALFEKYGKASDQMNTAITEMKDKYNKTITASTMIEGYDALKEGKWDEFIKENKLDKMSQEAQASLKKMISGFDDFGMSAFKAGQEYRTWEDAIMATKDAVSTKWMNIIKSFIGDLDAQKEFYSMVGEKFYDWFAAPLDEFQDILDEWIKEGGRDSLHSALSNIAKAIKSIVDPIKEAWDNVFEGFDAKKLLYITKAFENFTTKLKANEKVTSVIKNVFTAFFNVLKTGWNIVKLIGSTFVNILKIFKPFAEGLLIIVNALANVINNFMDWINSSRVLEGPLKIITNIIQSLVLGTIDLYYSIKNNEKIMTIINNLITSFKNIGGSVINILKTAWEFIKSIGSSLFNLLSIFAPVGKALLDIIGYFSELILKVTDYIKHSEKLQSAFSKIGEWIKKISEKIVEFFKSINFDKIVGFFKTIFGFLRKLGALVGQVLGKAFEVIAPNGSLKDIFDLAGAGLFVVLLKKLIDLFKKLKDGGGIVSSVKKIIDNISGVFESLTSCIDEFKNKIKLDELKKIATSIAILVASLFVLSMIDSEKLKSSVAALTVLFGELLVSFKILSMITDAHGGGTDKSVKTLFKMALSMFALALALKVLATMSWDEIGRGLAAMGGVFAELLIVIAIVNKAKLDNTKMPSFFAFAVGMVVIAGALKILATMTWDDIGRSLSAMGAVLFGFAAAIAIINKSSGDYKSEGLKGFFSFALSMLLFAGVMKILATMTWDDIGRALTIIESIVVSYIALMITVKKTSNTEGKAASIKGFLAFALGMIVLASALKSLSKMSWEDIERALVSMAGALLMFVLVIQLLNSSNNSVASASAILIMSASIIALALGLKVLATIPVDKLIKCGVALASFMAIMGIAAAILAPLSPIIITLSASFALLGAGAIALGAGLAIISAGIVAFALVITANIKLIIAAFLAIINGIADLLPAIFKVIKNLIIGICDVIIETAPKIAETLVKTLVDVLKVLVDYTPQLVSLLVDFIVSLFDSLTSKIPVIIKSLVNFVMAIFNGFTEALKDVNMSDLIKGLESIGIIALIMIELGALALLAPAAIVGVLAFGALIAELGAVIAAVGALNKIPGFNELVKSGGELLLSIGTAIGNFIGGLIGGIASGISDALPNIASNLSQFMVNLLPFITGMQLVPFDIVARIGVLAAGIAALSAANFIESITSILSFGHSLGDLGKDLSEFMVNATPFILGAATINSKVADNMAKLGSAILTITAADLLNNISSWLTGDNSLADFGDAIGSLGTSMATFSKNLGTFGEEETKTVDCASRAIVSLADAAKKIPNEGGLWGAIVGENSLSTFSGYLPGLGTDLADFKDNLGTFTDENVTTVDCASKAILSLAEAAKKIPNEGGLWAAIVGDNSLGKFSGYLPDLGTNLNKFGTNLGTFSDDQVATVECAAGAIASLAEVSKNIPKSGGVWQWLSGENDIKSFSEKLPSVAEGIKGFTDNLGTFGKDKVSSVNAASKVLEQLVNFAKVDINSLVSNLSSLGNKLSVFGNGIKDFVSIMSTMDGDSMKEATNNLALLSDEFINILSSEEMKKKIESVGKTFDEGFANGIKNNKKLVTDAVTDLGTDAYSYLKTAIDAHSPSRKTLELGNFFGMGFINGIKEYTSEAYSESESMANEATKGLTSAISKVNDILNDDTTNQPMIRPILDLSDIEDNASKIGNMFGNVDVGTNLNAISYGMRQRIQNGTNNDIVSAINKLDSKMGSTGNIYNINGVTYDDGSGVQNAVATLIRAANIERRS